MDEGFGSLIGCSEGSQNRYKSLEGSERQESHIGKNRAEAWHGRRQFPDTILSYMRFLSFKKRP